MLLIDDGQPEIFHDNRLLDQRMGPHHDVYFSFCKIIEKLASLSSLDRSRQQLDPDRWMAGQVFSNRRIVLLRQHLGWSHDRALAAISNGDQQSVKRHCGFSCPHISLQQPVHRPPRLQIFTEL